MKFKSLYYLSNIIFNCGTENLSKEEEKKFKEYLGMGRELLTKLKLLATLEKTSAMEKFEQSHVRKLSFAATEDTTSCVGLYLRN